MDEDDAGTSRLDVPISAVEHFSYCPRQCALIHVEQTFDENLYTIRGQLLHEVVDAGMGESSHGVRVLRALPLWSERYGLIGKADVVELRSAGPYPIEYKSGRSAESTPTCNSALRRSVLRRCSANRCPLVRSIRVRNVDGARSCSMSGCAPRQRGDRGDRGLLKRQVVPPPITDGGAVDAARFGRLACRMSVTDTGSSPAALSSADRGRRRCVSY